VKLVGAAAGAQRCSSLTVLLTPMQTNLSSAVRETPIE
jgi:hypothetical protein